MKYLLILMSAFMLASCSSYKNHYQKQKRDYSQCWCIDPWDGGGEWCCDGQAPRYMAPYRYKMKF